MHEFDPPEAPLAAAPPDTDGGAPLGISLVAVACLGGGIILVSVALTAAVFHLPDLIAALLDSR